MHEINSYKNNYVRKVTLQCPDACVYGKYAHWSQNLVDTYTPPPPNNFMQLVKIRVQVKFAAVQLHMPHVKHASV